MIYINTISPYENEQKYSVICIKLLKLGAAVKLCSDWLMLWRHQPIRAELWRR